MGESRIITVANQKGGAGKSTLCMLLATYLSYHYGIKVNSIIDTDPQQSIFNKRKGELKDMDLKEPPRFDVVTYDLTKIKQIPTFVKYLRNQQNTYIIDTPGTMKNDGTISFLALSDFILCPFDFDYLTLSSTAQFLKYWENFKVMMKEETGYTVNTEVILVPCHKPKNVGKQHEIELWEAVKSNFEKLYKVTPEIPELSCIRRVTTINIRKDQLEGAGDALNRIAEIIYNPNANNENSEEQDG